MDFVVVALQDEGTDGRMMADLLCHDGMSPDGCLEGLADGGVKGFVDVDEEEGKSNHDCIESFHPGQWVIRSFFQIERCDSDSFAVCL